MKAVIVGCGRVGASLADELDRAGWQVLILDVTTSAFDRLPSGFGGTALRGDGTDEDVLRRAGAADADLFLALTEGDNRNVMAAQLGIEVLGARQTVAKINDPVRAEAYAHLGIATLCRTNLMNNAVLGFLGQAAPGRPGIYAPAEPHLHEPASPATGDWAPGPIKPVEPGATGEPGMGSRGGGASGFAGRASGASGGAPGGGASGPAAFGGMVPPRTEA
jgi:trk system potassium uptake protein TrkA